MSSYAEVRERLVPIFLHQYPCNTSAFRNDDAVPWGALTFDTPMPRRCPTIAGNDDSCDFQLPHREVASMKRRTKMRRSNRQKTKLGLPDLEQVKSAVLVSLRSPESQRSYRHSIDDFVCWYCSEPRLSFNKTVVTRYRIHLEDRLLAPGTINVRLAAVRRLAYEAADSGLLA